VARVPVGRWLIDQIKNQLPGVGVKIP
jgi:hypothetical protein